MKEERKPEYPEKPPLRKCRVPRPTVPKKRYSSETNSKINANENKKTKHTRTHKSDPHQVLLYRIKIYC